MVALWSVWPETVEQEARRRFEAGERPEPIWRVVQTRGRREQVVTALMYGIGFALEQGRRDVDPWQELLREVTRCVHRINWYEAQIQRVVQTPEDLLPKGAAFDWIVMQGVERKNFREAMKLAQVAGIQAYQLQVIEQEAEAMMLAARAGLAALDIKGDDQERFLEAMSAELLRLTNQTPALEAS